MVLLKGHLKVIYQNINKPFNLFDINDFIETFFSFQLPVRMTKVIYDIYINHYCYNVTFCLFVYRVILSYQLTKNRYHVTIKSPLYVVRCLRRPC